MRATGPEAFTHTVFQNLQRTSTRNGILKGEAVSQFAQALERHRIEYVQDLPANLDGTSLDEAIRRIPGQNSGVGLRYFQMLAGGDDFIKPDRMIFRFLADALSRPVTPTEAQDILTAVSARFKPAVPALTPRLLDTASGSISVAEAFEASNEGRHLIPLHHTSLSTNTVCGKMLRYAMVKKDQ